MSLKPIKSKRSSRSRYPRLEGGHWGEKKKRWKFEPSKRSAKILILSLTLLPLLIVPAFAYYQFNVAPNLPGGSNYSQPDPFNVIWDGQVPTAFGVTSATTTHDGSCGGTCSYALPQVDVNNGNTFVLWIGGLGNPSTSISVTDGFGDTWTKTVPSAGNAGGCFGDFAEIWTATAGASGITTVVYTVTTGGGNDVFIALLQVYQGVTGFGNSATTAPAGTGSSASLTIATSTGSIVVGSAFAGINSGAITPGAGQTSRITNGFSADGNACSGGAGTNNIHGNLADEPQTAGSTTFTQTWTGTTLFAMAILELKGTPSITTFTGCSPSYACQNSVVSAGNIFTNPNSTFPGIALSTSAVDLSTGASKALAFTMTGIVNSSINTGQEVAWFLTLNSTLPTQASYNPLKDPSIVLLVFGVKQSTAAVNYYVYLQRQPGQTLSVGADDPGTSCQYGSTQFRCVSAVPFNTAGGSNNFHLVLNFTGGSNGAGGAGQSYLCGGSVASGPNTCNVGGIGRIADQNGGGLSFAGYLFNQTLFPWVNLQNNYHVGIWSGATGHSFEWVTATNANGAIFSVYTPNAALPGTTTEGGFFGWVGRALGGAWNAVAGPLGSVVNPILGLGNSLMSAFISALIQAGNLILTGLGVLQGLVVTVLNLVGNAAGFGNIGTTFQTITNQLITFFTTKVPTIVTNIPTLFSRFFDTMSVLFPWLPTALAVALNVLTLAINAMIFIPTLVGFIFFFVSGVFVTALILFWFIYTGDDALGGILAFVETAEWLMFGIGVRYLTVLINFLTDIITATIGLVPKPIVQIVAHAFPRIPIVEVNARFVSPSFDLGEIRSGNMLSALSWMIGITFLCWYESVTPALPGSLGALLPATLPSLVPLATLLPLLEILTALVGAGAFIFWPLTRTMEFLVGDVGGPMVTLGPGRRISGGPGAISISKGAKRFQGRLEKSLEKAGKLKEFQKMVAAKGLFSEEARAAA